ncbi:hypothetical protein Daus18300_002993 [Diaporthe australafricana]|uniref:Myb-like domain-containing protein n=1 Tax=Diaporthe australafricana TaxID=127596 RepID=A0ABR3XJA2_9PEZI
MDLEFHEDGGVLTREALIKAAIHELYPLRTMADDPSVADIEIACDAAVTVAEAFNEAHPESPGISLKWFYRCVQSLLIIDIKPALLDGEVQRLQCVPDPAGVAESVSENESASPARTKLDTARSTPEGSASSGEGLKPAAQKGAKAKWDDDEIQNMVELKASGLCHREIAEILGRRQGSVENKYGRVMHEERWIDHSTRFEASIRSENEQDLGDGDQGPSPKRRRRMQD